MLALCKCMLIIIATIQNNDKYCQEYSPELLQRSCIPPKYAESITLQVCEELSRHLRFTECVCVTCASKNVIAERRLR